MTRVKQEEDKRDAKQIIKDIKNTLRGPHDADQEADLERKLAGAYLQEEQITQAIVHFKNAENKYEEQLDFKKQSDTLASIAECYLRMGRYKDAIKNLKRQLKVVLDHFEAQTSLETAQQQIYFKLGLTYYMREKSALDEEETEKNFLEKSLKNLNKSLEIIKNSGDKWSDKIAENEIYNCLAMLHKSRKDYKRAIEYLKLVAPKTDCFHEDSLRDYITIAHCYAKLNNFKKASIYLEKTIKFMEDKVDLLHIRARVHADLGDYYFKLHEFDKSLLHFRKNLRIFKQTRFDKEKFENAVENLRSARKAVIIANKRKEIAKKLKATKPADIKTRMKLLEQTADYAFDLSDEKEAIDAYSQILELCKGDVKKTLAMNRSIGTAYDTLATKESSVEYAKKAMEHYNRNYELCKEKQNDSGMAQAIMEKATTMELPVLKTPKTDILAEYKRAAVLATRSRNYTLLANINDNISALFENWPGKESQAEAYTEKADEAREKAQESAENESEAEENEEEEEEEDDEDNDEDLRDVQDYLDGNITVEKDPAEMKTDYSYGNISVQKEEMKMKLGSFIKRLQEKQKKKSSLVPLQEGKYDKKGNLLPSYRDDFIVQDIDMHPNAKKSLNRLLQKEEEPIIVKTETSKSGNVKTESPDKETKGGIEQFIHNARQKRKEQPRKEIDDEALTPYQEQRKRLKQTEQIEKDKLQAKKLKKEEKSNSPEERKQHVPEDSLLETTIIDKETGRKVLINKQTNKVLRSFKDDWLVADEDEDYDSDDLNADYDSEEENKNSDKKHLPSYTKSFIVDDP
eukprot:Phypoly_transcript_02785.p1 GENE.Phypoly_transcript_02785~~Phypoly_transcript_02785.p1  ORF type:complete len:823 (+),score=202.19 Phypoly_transcript_02785:69-2471(+)